MAEAFPAFRRARWWIAFLALGGGLLAAAPPAQSDNCPGVVVKPAAGDTVASVGDTLKVDWTIHRCAGFDSIIFSIRSGDGVSLYADRINVGCAGHGNLVRTAVLALTDPRVEVAAQARLQARPCGAAAFQLLDTNVFTLVNA